MININWRSLFISLILASIPTIVMVFSTMLAGNFGVLLGLYSAMAIVLYVILHVKRGLNRKITEVHASAMLSAISFKTLLPTSYFALTPTKILSLLHEIQFRKPELVVECGTGASTLFIARILKALKTGRLISIEHDHQWGNYIQELLIANDLEDVVHVIHAELKETECWGYQTIWYDKEVVKRALPTDGGIEVLLIDGPPGTAGFLPRMSAGPFLADYLRQGAIVMVDDMDRGDERRMVTEWQANLAMQMVKSDHNLGYVLLQYNPTDI